MSDQEGLPRGRAIHIARCPVCGIVWDTDERDGTRVLAEHGERVAPNGRRYDRMMRDAAEEILAATGRGDYEAADRAARAADSALAMWKAEHGRCVGSGTATEAVLMGSPEGRALVEATIAEKSGRP